MISRNRLERLAKRAEECQRRIADSIERGAVRVEGYIAWGQFLDAPRKTSQYGLYGTSAAIQVLVSSGHSPESPLVSKAIAALPEVLPNEQNKGLYDKTDLAITFKEAAILEAAQPNAKEFAAIEPIEAILLSQIIDQHGWGNYFDASDQDDSPRVLPTAHALLALRRSRDFRGSEKCEAVLNWLCNAVDRTGTMPIHEAAMALLALIEYKSPGVGLSQYQITYSRLLGQVNRWTRRRPEISMGETTAYHYWAFSNEAQRNHYVFYMPDIIAALALLRSGNPKSSRGKVTEIVDLVCSAVTGHGGFPAKTSQRIATVDQLWVYRLLDEFTQTFVRKPADLVAPTAYVVSATPVRRAAFTAGVLLLGAAGTLLSTLDWLDVVERTAGATLAAVALGLLASALFVWLRGE